MENNLAVPLMIIFAVAFLIAIGFVIKLALQSIEVTHAVTVSNMKRDFYSMRTDRDNNRRAAKQAAIVMENRVNAERAAQGLPPFTIVADVKPEHNSPVTAEQDSAAQFATIRARITAAALAMDEEVPEIESPNYPEERV